MPRWVSYDGIIMEYTHDEHCDVLLTRGTCNSRLEGCAQDIHCTAGVGCDRIIMEHTHDEHCDVLLTRGTCNSPAGAAAWEYAVRCPGRRHPDGNVFRRLEKRLRDAVTRECRTLTAVRAPVNEDAIAAAAEREPWRSSRVITREQGLSPREGHRSTL
jgi:hypothetical protein